MNSEKELRSLCRRVRRDEAISNGAARLFAEVIDLHLMDEGCFAQDPTLADWLNMSTRTVRRRRKELYRAGYLVERADDGRRHLVPQRPAPPDKNGHSDNSVRTNLSSPDKIDRTKMATPDKNGHAPPDKNGQHREINNNSGRRAGEGARASARGDDSGDQAGPFEVETDSVDAITETAFGEPIRGLTVKDEIRTYCERAGPAGWDCLRSVCKTIREKGWNPTAQLVKKKLADQLALLEESDEAYEPDDFASQAQRIFDAAGDGASAHR